MSVFEPLWERKKTLTLRMKEFLELKARNLSIAEIAALKGVTYGTANNILVTARKRLKEGNNGTTN